MRNKPILLAAALLCLAFTGGCAGYTEVSTGVGVYGAGPVYQPWYGDPYWGVYPYYRYGYAPIGPPFYSRPFYGPRYWRPYAPYRYGYGYGRRGPRW
jgi:hypothetical protein